MEKELISVVMPAYNSALTVGEAVGSVINQSYSHWELLVVDDGSSDNTGEVVRSFHDGRVRLIANEHDFIGSLNKGLSLSKGSLIARMDADDRMHPDRLRIQHALMSHLPTVDILGSWMIPFGENEKPGGLVSSTCGPVDNPVKALLDGNFMYHPTVCMQSGFLKKHGLVYRDYLYAEDYKLWADAAMNGAVFYIDSQPLLFYRTSGDRVCAHKYSEQRKSAIRVVKDLAEYLIAHSDDSTALYQRYIQILNTYETETVPCSFLAKQLMALFE